VPYSYSSFLVWEEANEPTTLVFIFVVKLEDQKDSVSVKGTKEILLKRLPYYEGKKILQSPYLVNTFPQVTTTKEILLKKLPYYEGKIFFSRHIFLPSSLFPFCTLHFAKIVKSTVLLLYFLAILSSSSFLFANSASSNCKVHIAKVNFSCLPKLVGRCLTKHRACHPRQTQFPRKTQSPTSNPTAT
jgi:hypothetical protein